MLFRVCFCFSSQNAGKILYYLKLSFCKDVLLAWRNYANLLDESDYGNSSTPKGMVWDTNMAAFSLCWSTNMAAVTSHKMKPLLRLYYLISGLPSFLPNSSYHQLSSTQKTTDPFQSVWNLVSFPRCCTCPRVLCSCAGIPANHRMVNTPKQSTVALRIINQCKIKTKLTWNIKFALIN